MQDNDKNTNPSKAPEQKLTPEEAEKKVAEMFALASPSNKNDKKKKKEKASSNETFTPYNLPETQASLSKTDNYSTSKKEPKSKKEDIVNEKVMSLTKLTESELKPDEAEKKIAELFAVASTQNPHSKSKGSNLSDTSLEIIILELISILLFAAARNSDTLWVFSPVAIFLPVLLGIGYRIYRYQYTLKEAASRCKLHMVISAFFYICVILSV
ncbi:MAG: hypothetical protein IKS13_05460 [Ruminococcus sp.]|nr:hypothetical protein [Ruminococcus sp.]